MNLFSLIADRRGGTPERALVEPDGGAARDWRGIDADTGRYANLLAGLGLKRGDRVAVQAEKSPNALLLYLGCLRAGLVYLPMNTAYRAEEVAFLLGNAEPGLLVCDPAAEAGMRDLARQAGVARVLTMDAKGGGSLDEAARGSSSAHTPVACADGDPACILYTSGTTGRPKGAVLSHGNLIVNALDLVGAWGIGESDVLIHALPIFHAHGLFVACHTSLIAGARMIWMAKFDAGAVLAALPRATMLMGVPTFYVRLLAQPGLDRGAAAHMRLFVSGSAPLLEETFRAFQERTGHAILERYGMTETGMNTSNPLHGERRAGTVGFPLPSTEVRIRGEDGRILGADAVGGVEVRGGNVFSGYWRLPEKTAEDFTADGWFKTGDVGLIDARGYVHLVGRAKDLVISGGFNVYPKEIEGVIDRMAGVVESAVIGVPHADFGEAVVAVVHRAANGPGEDEVIAWVKQRLAGFKVPRRVVFVPELPRNTMGKVQKNLLRQTYGKPAKPSA